MFTSVLAAQQTQMPPSAPVQQMPGQRKLVDVRVTQYTVDQYLPPAQSSQHAFSITLNLPAYLFLRSADVGRHVRTKHTRERPYPCYFCSKRFLRSDHARNHLKNVHSEEFDQWLKEHGCSHGDNPSAFPVDRKRPHKEQWTCAFCRQKFDGPEILKSHILSEHPVNPQ